MGEVSMTGKGVSSGRVCLAGALLLVTAGVSAAADGDTRLADAAMRRDVATVRTLIAQKVDALSKLLEARKQLSNLITYMDGKSGAEELVSKLLQDSALLQTLASQKNPQEEPSS